MALVNRRMRLPSVGKIKAGLLGLVETKFRTCNFQAVAHSFPGRLHPVPYNEYGKDRLWMM